MMRPLFIAALLAVAQVAVLYIERGYTLGSVVPPARDVSELPPKMGPWSGETQEVNEQLKDFLQSRSGIDRVYRKPTGDAVITHLLWTDDYIRVHFPEHCYRQAGWEKVDSVDLEINPAEELPSSVVSANGGPGESSDTFPARLLTFRQEEQEIQVLYWFQMGSEPFFDRIQHRSLRRQVCWGNREWPPLIKVMLQSSGRRSEDHLTEMAARIHHWLNES